MDWRKDLWKRGVLSLEWKVEGVIDGESEGDDCDGGNKCKMRSTRTGGEWARWGWPNEGGRLQAYDQGAMFVVRSLLSCTWTTNDFRNFFGVLSRDDREEMTWLSVGAWPDEQQFRSLVQCSSFLQCRSLPMLMSGLFPHKHLSPATTIHATNDNSMHKLAQWSDENHATKIAVQRTLYADLCRQTSIILYLMLRTCTSTI